MSIHTLLSLAAGAAIGMAAAGFWAWRKILNPIAEISRFADQLARGEHGARVRLPINTHLGRLGTTLNLLAERFQHDISELRRLEQVRKEFVANVSHELRTPLSAIKAFSETLSAGGINDSKHRLEFVREIESNSDRMVQLVDDLLTLSALESGKMPPNFETIDIGKSAGEAVASLVPLAQKKQTIIRLEPFYEVPRVRADRHQLKQVFTNLIENAIKYTPEKGTIRVSAASDNGRVTVSVADSGPGIPPEDLPRIFERFYRVDKARSRELGGTGLGLAIVKHILEVHGGSVSAESRIGEGSIFRFTLPAA